MGKKGGIGTKSKALDVSVRSSDFILLALVNTQVVVVLTQNSDLMHVELEKINLGGLSDCERRR